MNSLRTLFDAFDGLEEQADAARRSAGDRAAARRPVRRTRLLAPAAAATAVVLAAAGIAVWQGTSSSGPARKAANPVGGTAPAVAPTVRASVATTPAGNGTYQPPSTSAALTAQARTILAGTATIEVDPDLSQPGATGGGAIRIKVGKTPPGKINGPVVPLPASNAPDASSGAGIVGTLTAGNQTGGFDLDVFATTPPLTAMCDSDTNCSVTTLPDGTSLAVGHWNDPTVGGGITYQVEAVRRDGADILMHLSTEHDPKGQSTVTASHLPLTVQQMIDFVTSDRW